MYLCGNCRIVTSDSLRECYEHAAHCTDYYFNRITDSTSGSN